MLGDQLRRAWGFLLDRLVRSMGCLFRCFRARDDDAGPKLRISVSDPVQAPLVSRNKLSSLLLVEEHSPIDDARRRPGSEYSENNDEEVGLRDEATFLKACGAVLHTPAEIRNGSEKIGTGEGENLSARFDSWFSGAAYRQQNTCDSPRFASLPDGVHGALPSVIEPQVQSPTDEKVPPSSTLRSSSKDQVEIMINQSSMKSVRFQTDISPNLSNERYNIQRGCGFLESEDEKSSFAGKWLSPYPTPLVIPNGAQTPGTVYPTKMESLDSRKSTWVRPQFVYPVHNVDVLSKSNTMKDDTADPSEEVSSGLGNSDKRFDLERPIIGGVAVYWDDKEQTEVSPKEWDGNGIPNSTTKYKEDQRVSWHATPFEERLEKALSDERLQPRRTINQLPIFYEDENDTATSFSALTDIAV